MAAPVDPWDPDKHPDPDELIPDEPERSPLARWSPAAVAERVRVWVRFTGPARVASGLGAAVVVAGVAFWLLRTPSPPTEAGLPYASASTTTTSTAVSSGVTATAAVTTSTAPAVVVVHVTGAVAVPGVYRLPSASRVGDAIAAAGGATPEAAADALNLAAPVLDGDRIEVPTGGELTVPSFTTLPVGQLHVVSASVPAGPLDVNVATVDELEALPGIGPATAAAIVAYRTEHGPFGAVDELEEVPGIGPAKLAGLRDLVTV